MRAPDILSLVVLAGSLCAATAADLPHRTPGRKALAKMDFAFRNATLWHGTPPGFDGFHRYYAGVTVKGRHMIRAEFAGLKSDSLTENDKAVLDRPSSQVVRSPDGFPAIFGGGCSVVNMLYDVEADRMAWIRCNGLD